ncbi:KpsF/GutQ family sugar-phosphate isomerase [Henriciella sp. AS95]|uniref:KpsF/GutQ family sugar-phosphate isomerase n=1 Tax=Henriciella sp. AS95 TaxID=3135782 RepID=UPI00317CF56A
MSHETILASGQRVIRTEIDALEMLFEALDETFVKAVETIVACQGRVILAGVGKSGHVARKIAATLSSTGTPSLYVHPTEASHGDLGMIAKGDVVIALSRSGETKELDDLLTYTRRFSISLIAMTAVADSALGKASDICLTIPDAPEACDETRAPTTSTTLMMALGDALAVAVLEQRGFTGSDFKLYHPGGKLGAMLRTAGDLMHVGDELPIVQTGTMMSEALDVMAQKGLGCLAIVEPGGDLIGMVTDGDIRRLVAKGRMAMVIDEGMTRNPTTISASMLASAALALMNEKRITQLIITEETTPVGVVHMHDFLKAGVA